MFGCSFCGGLKKLATYSNKLVKCDFCENKLCELHSDMAKKWCRHYYNDDCIMCNDCVVWTILT